MLQYAAEASGLFVRIQKPPGITIVDAGRLCLQPDLAAGHSLLVSAPYRIQRAIIHQLLENDVAVDGPKAALLGLFFSHFSALQLFIDALQRVRLVQPW